MTSQSNCPARELLRSAIASEEKRTAEEERKRKAREEQENKRQRKGAKKRRFENSEEDAEDIVPGPNKPQVYDNGPDSKLIAEAKGKLELDGKETLARVTTALAKKLCHIACPELARLFSGAQFPICLTGSTLIWALLGKQDLQLFDKDSDVDFVIHARDEKTLVSAFQKLQDEKALGKEYQLLERVTYITVPGMKRALRLYAPGGHVDVMVLEDTASVESFVGKFIGDWCQVFFDFNKVTVLHPEAIRDRTSAFDEKEIDLRWVRHLKKWSERGFDVTRTKGLPCPLLTCEAPVSQRMHVFLDDGNELIIKAGNKAPQGFHIQLVPTVHCNSI